MLKLSNIEHARSYSIPSSVGFKHHPHMSSSLAEPSKQTESQRKKEKKEMEELD